MGEPGSEGAPLFHCAYHVVLVTLQDVSCFLSIIPSVPDSPRTPLPPSPSPSHSHSHSSPSSFGLCLFSRPLRVFPRAYCFPPDPSARIAASTWTHVRPNGTHEEGGRRRAGGGEGRWVNSKADGSTEGKMR